MAGTQPKTYQEVIDVLLEASEGVYDAKAAFVRLTVPFAEMKAQRASAGEWIDEIADELASMVTRLREAQAAMAKAGMDVDGTQGAAKPAKPAARPAAKPAAKPAANGNGNGNKQRSTGGRAAPRTKGGGGKVTADGAKHKVEVPAA